MVVFGRRVWMIQAQKEPEMRWQTPRIVAIACGCEINGYIPADL